MKDDFSDPNSGWDTYNNAVVTAEFVNDAYRMRLKKPHQLRYSFLILNKSFSGVSVEVDVTNSGTPGPAGVQCVHGSGTYDFVIRTETAEYFIGKFTKATGEKLLTQGENAAAVRSGTNHIKGECVGGVEGKPTILTMWVNGQQLIQVNDSQGLQSFNGIGLVVVSGKKGGTEAVFDNALMSILS